MSRDIYKRNIEQMLLAIDLCLEKGLITSTLTLIYSAIDCMSALGRPADKDEATREDFINWTENYIIPYLNSDCTPLELYSARCGIVHTYTPDSSHTRSGSARTIYYAWGSAKARDLKKSIKFIEKAEGYTAVQVEVLVESLRKGIQDFEDNILSTEMEKVALERARNFFVNMPSSDIDKVMPVVNNELEE